MTVIHGNEVARDTVIRETDRATYRKRVDEEKTRTLVKECENETVKVAKVVFCDKASDCRNR